MLLLENKGGENIVKIEFLFNKSIIMLIVVVVKLCF